MKQAAKKPGFVASRNINTLTSSWEGFRFPPEQRAALLSAGVRPQLMEVLEARIQHLREDHGLEPGHVPRTTAVQVSRQAKALAMILDKAAAAIAGLRLSDRTIDDLDLKAHGRAKLLFNGLRSELRTYARAATASAKANRDNRSPDAERKHHAAILIGQTLLREGGHVLDDRADGIFHKTLAATFNALDSGSRPMARAPRQGRGRRFWDEPVVVSSGRAGDVKNWAKAALKALGEQPKRGKPRGRDGRPPRYGW